MRRASAPPTADAQSSGKSLNTPKKNAAPQASRRSESRGALTEKLGRVRVIAAANNTTDVISPASAARSRPDGTRHPHDRMTAFHVRRDKASYGQHAVILLSKALRKFSNITFLW